MDLLINKAQLTDVIAHKDQYVITKVQIYAEYDR